GGGGGGGVGTSSITTCSSNSNRRSSSSSSNNIRSSNSSSNSYNISDRYCSINTLSAIMSKLLVSLVVFAIVFAVNVHGGCRRDTCQGRPSGIYPSTCNSCGQYVTCDGSSDTPVGWGACRKWGWCLGGCGGCSSDSCYWKPNGDYQSLEYPRPFYYSCHYGYLSYKTCHPNERFNPWTRRCGDYKSLCWSMLCHNHHHNHRHRHHPHHQHHQHDHDNDHNHHRLRPHHQHH
ncbi:hypothetical protein LSAT2_017309, partial [Lamellibrachia satsuma]